MSVTSPTTPPAPPDLLVLTWNLDSNIEAAKLAVAHLESQVAAGLFCVASFQESPEGLDSLVVASPTLTAHSKATRIAGTKAPGNVVVTSSEIVLDPEGRSHENNATLDDQRRMEGRTFACEHWSGLHFLAVHGWDRRSRPTESERADWADLVRGVLSSFWRDGPLIVAGDLNANPWHREVTYRKGWFASRTADQGEGKAYKLPNKEEYAKQLMNPMWKVVANERLPGTCFYDHDDILWHCLDQVLVSKDLFNQSLSPVVRDTMMKTLLLDSNGEPAREKGPEDKPIYVFSNHLPVELILPGEIVKSACSNKSQRK
jgi:endonuclease/exonuclease/phosphatase family metal-dependent hydrolase